MSGQVCVAPENETFYKKAEALAQQYGLPLFNGSYCEFSLLVGDQISLRWNDEESPQSLVLDFSKGALDFRRRFGGAGGQLVLKAVGGSKKKVFDATAGLCRDAFILASYDCEVRAVEKSPVIAALVVDALARGREIKKLQNLCDRIQFETGDSANILSNMQHGDFEVIYLDPMFPGKEKSSLPKKELRLMQLLLKSSLENEREAQSLLELARKKGKRVVVKRPSHGPLLAENPSIQFKGSSIRFDVYLQ